VAGVERGVGPGERLVRPVGLATLDGRRFAVADPDSPGLFLAGNGALERLECPGLPWSAPLAVAYAPGGALLVADAGAGRVVRLESGTCRVELEGLERPVGVAISAGRAFAVDGPRHEVVAAGAPGTPALHFGAEVLASPVAIAADADGNLLVADALEARVVRFTADGRVLATVGGRAPEAGGLLRPKAVAAGPGGRVLVLEASQDRVAVFSADGLLLAYLGEPGAGPGHFSQATGLAVAAPWLAVVEAGGRIQIFELVGGTS
jgi:DNA-binding beta-propeller fold protein YncE